MVELVRNEQIGDKTALIFKGLKSICPFTHTPDVATVELDCTMRKGQTQIDTGRLLTYLDSFGNTEIAMEMIPLEIIKFCVNESMGKRPATGWKYAAPDAVSVKYKLFEGKTWGMTASVDFSREVK